MDAMTAITRDHERLTNLMRCLRDHEAEPVTVMAELRARLAAHTTAEEELVYGPLLGVDPAEEYAVRHGITEHRDAENRLAAAQAAVGTAGFDTLVAEFVDAVTLHIREEESRILPDLVREVSEEQLERLGALFEDRRRSELDEAGFGYSAG
ncbi:hemerythrin domain-containing protein [Longispora sp. K20-0274]|uniref:hemerythrin domain-containing protein n=1 Tax=Longispora sp. K20-0274 TaxID=3088255 RepID=UPI00399983E0